MMLASFFLVICFSPFAATVIRQSSCCVCVLYILFRYEKLFSVLTLYLSTAPLRDLTVVLSSAGDPLVTSCRRLYFSEKELSPSMHNSDGDVPAQIMVLWMDKAL